MPRLEFATCNYQGMHGRGPAGQSSLFANSPFYSNNNTAVTGAWGLWEPRHRIPRTHITFSVAHEYTGRRGPLFPVICAVYETVDVSGWSWITSLLVQNRFPKQSLVDAYFDVLTARMRRYAPRHHMYDKWKQVGMMSINLYIRRGREVRHRAANVQIMTKTGSYMDFDVSVFVKARSGKSRVFWSADSIFKLAGIKGII